MRGRELVIWCGRAYAVVCLLIGLDLIAGRRSWWGEWELSDGFVAGNLSNRKEDGEG
jgi:hypothetical protein